MIVYLVLNPNHQPEQIFASEDDAVMYVNNKGLVAPHTIQPFHLSALGKGGIVVPFDPQPPATAKEENQPQSTAPVEPPEPAVAPEEGPAPEAPSA